MGICQAVDFHAETEKNVTSLSIFGLKSAPQLSAHFNDSLTKSSLKLMHEWGHTGTYFKFISFKIEILAYNHLKISSAKRRSFPCSHNALSVAKIQIHYNDVIMSLIVSQITSLTIVYTTVYSDTDQRKHQSSASLAFVWGIYRGPVNSPHKWPVTRKIFAFDDVIMRIGDNSIVLSKTQITIWHGLENTCSFYRL